MMPDRLPRPSSPAGRRTPLGSDLATDAVWDSAFVARYLGIVALAGVGASVRSIGPNRFALAFGVLVGGIAYNLVVQRMYLRRGHPPASLSYFDMAVCLLIALMSHHTLIPAEFVMLSVVALAAAGFSRRTAAQVAMVGTIGLIAVCWRLQTADSALNIVGFAIVSAMVAGTVGPIAESDRHLRRRLSSLVEGLDLIVWERDPETLRFVYVSSKVESILGYPRKAWLDDGFWVGHIHPDDAERALRECRSAGSAPGAYSLEYRMVGADGRVVHLQDLGTNGVDHAGRVICHGASVDISERKQAERRTRRYADIVEAIELGLFVIRPDDVDDVESLRLLAVNPAGRSAAEDGRPLDEVIGERVIDVFPVLHGSDLLHRLTDVARTGRQFTVDEITIRTGFERDATYSLMAFPLPDQTVGVSLRDVTSTVIASEALRRQALHDGLTGLPNRRYLSDRLRIALAEAQAGARSVCLLLLDLDQFKEVNDALGHQVGDAILVALGRRLEQLIGPNDFIARLGGDEFAILLTGDVTVQTGVGLAQRIETVLADPFCIDDLRLQTKASVGVALFPEHAGDAEELTQRADVAMYVAKRAGGGHAVYRPEDDRSSVRRLTMLGDLGRAIEHDQLVLHFQPMVDCRTGRVARAEALVRWQHPEIGLLPPYEFVALAELSGFIQPMTRWVLGHGIETAAAWRAAGHPVGLSVNLSVRNLHEPDLPDFVADILDRTGFPAAELTLEVTETELMADPVLALDVLHRLSALGIRTAVDDFGTGYSSLTYLKDLPVTEIKIDRSFVADVDSQREKLTIIRSMIELGHNLSLEVVAEGVETEGELSTLQDLRCDLIQGYLFSAPLPLDELYDWFAQRLPSPAVLRAANHATGPVMPQMARTND